MEKLRITTSLFIYLYDGKTISSIKTIGSGDPVFLTAVDYIDEIPDILDNNNVNLHDFKMNGKYFTIDGRRFPAEIVLDDNIDKIRNDVSVKLAKFANPGFDVETKIIYGCFSNEDELRTISHGYIFDIPINFRRIEVHHDHSWPYNPSKDPYILFQTNDDNIVDEFVEFIKAHNIYNKDQIIDLININSKTKKSFDDINLNGGDF